ncbi:MAG: Beta-lactamase precursor [Pseudomonadota bacterium]|jgi:glyoxylase-like metal-dependent hydrolase (beta-lactamase superfamily II)
MKRRQLLGWGLGVTGVTLWPELQIVAQQAQDFIQGPPMPDIGPVQVSPHVWVIHAADGFPTPENKGMMSNVTFVTTSQGVVIIDSGSSVQIGEMALRMIRRITPLPVVAVFNSHFHGDHWLGNHAFARHFGESLPIYALPHTIEQIKGIEGSSWRNLMERWTNQSTVGTQVVPPNRSVEPGQRLQIGEIEFRMHFYGQAHTRADLCVQVVPDGVTHVGDIAMANRIANIDDGSYQGTLKYYAQLKQATGPQRWIPGHGSASTDLLDTYGLFLSGIYDNCLQAVKDGVSEAEAKARVLQDPRVASRAKTMQGFDSNIGKYVSLAYLEAEKEAF